MAGRRALITGITGQDGSYLAELLLEKDYEVFGMTRRASTENVERIAHLKERRQVRIFVRADPYGRFVSCLVYLPRDRYTGTVRRKMEQLLLDRLGG